MFLEKDGFFWRLFFNGWKGECGLYVVGFIKCGLLGVLFDVNRIVEEIG